MNREMEPGLVAILLVRSTIVAYPEQVIALLASFLDSGEVACAEVTVKSYHRVLAFLELLSDALRIKSSQVKMIWMRQWKVCRVLCQLMRRSCTPR